jgi:subtilisin family serine protease
VDYYANGSLWGMYGDASAPANSFGSQAAEAWGEVAGSRTVYVGIIDEGVQVTHPDLDANAWTNPFDPVDGVDNDRNGFVDDVHGYDFANNDTSVYDGGTRGSADDHGTHVAGTIGAENGGELGVRGVNHSVTMISGKFLGARGGTSADAVRAVRYFTDLKTRHGLDVVATNNSWGGGGFSQALRDAIAEADQAGILFVAAAGNSGTDNDATRSYPSGYDLPNVIAVAAIDKQGALAGFSQYGATTVDLGAPGVDVWSTTAFSTYSTYNGTSMATPHVTGAAALYAATRPGASAAEIKAAILRRARSRPRR